MALCAIDGGSGAVSRSGTETGLLTQILLFTVAVADPAAGASGGACGPGAGAGPGCRVVAGYRVHVVARKVTAALVRGGFSWQLIS